MSWNWKQIGKLLCVGVLLFALMGADTAPLFTAAEAVSQSEIDALKDDAKALAAERSQMRSELAKLKNDRSSAVKYRVKLDEQITLTEREIANTESLIAGYDALMAQTEYELELNAQEEAERYAVFCERARIMEEAGTTSYWSVLFKATSFADLLSRLSDVKEVMDYDQSVLDNLRSIRAEIEEKNAYQLGLKGEAEVAKATLEEKKADLAVQREEANEVVKTLEANVAEYQAVFDEIAAEEERINQEIIEKSIELAKQMSQTASVGGYIWPVATSRRITSPQGSRNTGIKGASTNHKGVDIGGVGYNTNVLAAKAGVVITSAYSSSYGNYVVISHGPGNTTLYAHMSSRAVKEGAIVTQGQVIGITGSTGISSGPHLHYEIVESSKRVNPLDYLPGYIQAW